MRLNIDREKLLAPLQAISGVIERRQSLPILSNVLIIAKGDLVTFVATDLEVEMIVELDHHADTEGDSTLPARKIFDICRTLPSSVEIEIACDGEHAVVRSGKSRFRLATIPSAEFPTIGNIDVTVALVVPSQGLKRIIDDTLFAMAHQDVRYYLNGLLLEIEGQRIRSVATDGHRLAMSDMEIATVMEEPCRLVVPRKGVIEFSRMLEGTESEACLSLSANHIQLQLGRRRFTSKLIDGRFPDYERVLPRKGDKVLVAEREVLRQGLLRNSILSNEKFKGVRIALRQHVWRSWAHNPEREEAEEEIEVNYDGEPLEIGFNVSYLLDVLSVIKTDKVRFEFTDASSSCLIRPDGRLESCYVVMPMRL